VASAQIPMNRTCLFDSPFFGGTRNMGLYLRKFSYNVNIFLKEKLQFAERLRALRDQKGLSNLELGKSVGLSHVSIGNFLEGQLPKSEHLHALAEFFGVTTDHLLGREKSPSPPALHEAAPEYLLDDALAELEALKEKVLSLERALKRLKQERDRSAAQARKAAESGRKSQS
jgi:transcriptional regulator with XRE-family HTH domain